MDSDSNSTKIERLNNNNYHAWKIRIQHVQTLIGLLKYLFKDPPSLDEYSSNLSEVEEWSEKDARAQAVIGPTLSDELLENVCEVTSAKEMWTAIKNVFERHTLLNKLSSRRKFYTATLSDNESILSFTNRIRQLAATLKSMNVDISESEMSMALLNGLSDDYNAIITALDAIDNKETELRWEFVKPRIMQEMWRAGE